jgi:DNA polymerase III delta' subunit
MPLKNIFCQDKAISILQRAYIAEKLPHACIFAGPDGVGRFSTAREWAKLLLCDSPVKNDHFADSCGNCRSCRKFEVDAHPDFNIIYKELSEFTRDGRGRATPVDLPIDVIREFLIEKVSSKPALSKRRVFIVTEAEKLNINSQNCLLKVLEEPPAYCTIILICSQTEKLLATTKSRCHTVRFGLISQAKIIEQLQQTGLDEQKSRYFACLAQGSLGETCKWAGLEQAGACLYETRKKLVCMLAELRLADAVSLAARLLETSKGLAGVWTKLQPETSPKDISRRAHKILVRIIISALYDAMKANCQPDAALINFDQKEQILKLAENFTTETLAEKIVDAYRTIDWIDASVNEVLIFEQLLLNLAVSDTIKV